LDLNDHRTQKFIKAEKNVTLSSQKKEEKLKKTCKSFPMAVCKPEPRGLELVKMDERITCSVLQSLPDLIVVSYESSKKQVFQGALIKISNT
jgi:hypothetical protein